ncbi:MAG: hypothetical protein HY815_32965 [Candidatus Riflebacteria bacterium]|nr:hypothetical protein [Candidatus Riflebacteria bacterium]
MLKMWLVLCLALVSGASFAGPWDDLKPLIPAEADFVVFIQAPPGTLLDTLSTFSLSPPAARRVMDEHCKGFEREAGFDPSQMRLIAVTGGTKSKDAPVFLASAGFDTAKVAQALQGAGQSGSLAVKEAPGGLFVKAGDLILGFMHGNSIIAGSSETVKALVSGRTAAGGKGPLIEQLAARAGESVRIGALVVAPTGAASLKLPVPPNVDPALWEHVRALFIGVLEKDYQLSLVFDNPEAASKAEPIVPELLKTLKGKLAEEVAIAEKSAKAQGAMGWLDPTWINTRISLETLAEYTPKLSPKVEGPTLTIQLAKDALPLAAPTMAVVGVLAAIAVPNFKEARLRANFRACYANQKTVAGAIEMYNLDKNTKAPKLDQALFETLKKEGYLQAIPSDPGQGPDTWSHYQMVDSGSGITCSVHGSVDGSVKGTLAMPGASAPFMGGQPVSSMFGNMDSSNQRACFANQKVIAGAIEMYALDKNTKVTEINRGLLDTLKKDGYLMSVPSDPGQGPDSSANYYMVPTGNGVACKVHGDIGGLVKGTKSRPVR